MNVPKLKRPPLHSQAMKIDEKKLDAKLTALANSIEKQFVMFTQVIEKRMIEFSKGFYTNLEKHSDLIADLEVKLSTWEDTFYYLYHNIKKNQFLYAHYPDEWAKNYTTIKEGIKDENDFMDKKIVELKT